MPIISGGGENGGSGLPAQWTVDAAGNVIIAPTLEALGGVGDVHIVAPLNAQDGMTITDSTNPTGANFGIDPFGYILGQGADLGAAGEDVTVLRVAGSSGTGQIQDIAQFSNDTVPRRVRVIRSGHLLLTGANAAPADADLSANDLAFWYDSTNGASKLMVKAKQADGTVKTASVPLA